MSGRVIVVGSLHHDIMVAARARPRKGETVFGERWWPKSGGKGGNQAVEAAIDGADVAMIGAVGNDDFGASLIAHLDRAGVDRSGIAQLPGAASGMSVAIFDAEGDYGAVVVSGANQLIDARDLTAARFAGAAVVVLQNEIAESANVAAARAARAAGARVILNAAPAREPDPKLAADVDILVVNAIEAEMLGSAPIHSLPDADIAASHLGQRFPVVIVTAGGAGVAVAAGGERFSVEGARVPVESTHGAGDCFVGVLASRLARGAGLKDAVTAANLAAGALVATPEAARPGRLTDQSGRKAVSSLDKVRHGVS